MLQRMFQRYLFWIFIHATVCPLIFTTTTTTTTTISTSFDNSTITPFSSNYTCINNTNICSNCANGHSYDQQTGTCIEIKTHQINSVYGQECSKIEDRDCDSGLNCTNDRNNTLRCLCSTSQFWSAVCLDNSILNFTLQNISTIKGTNNITFNWIENTENITGVKYYIVTLNDSIEANSTGGFITGLEPGNKYNFEIVSVPPEDNFTTYSNVSLSLWDLWTNAVYGQECNNKTEDRNCDSGLTCMNDRNNTQRCLCSSTYQFYSAGCLDYSNLKDALQNITTIKGTNNITFSWIANTENFVVVNYYNYTATMSVSKEVRANSAGVCISGLQPGTKYNFEIVSVPPTDNYTTYNNVVVLAKDFWTDAVYGQECNETEGRNCNSDFNCTNDRKKTFRCLCSASQFWSACCLDNSILNFTLQNISTIKGTNNITFNWIENTENVTGVKYYIVTLNDSIEANSTGGCISGLQPGTKYNFKIVSVPPRDNYTTYNNFTVTTGDLWTYPAKPGQVVDVIQELETNSYKIIFDASAGNVNKYHITVRDTDNKRYVNESSNTTILIKELIPGRIYTYCLYAVNGLGDKSEVCYGQFPTHAKASGQVTNVTISDLTNTSVTINWQKPTLPNGNISGYLVEVKLNDSCVHADRILCMDCHNRSVGAIDCNNVTEVKDIHQDLDYNLNIRISDLKSFQNYNVCITALNEAGTGQSRCQEFHTYPGTPYMVMNVTYELISYPPKGTPITVGLMISWTPGKYTGPTSYTVCLKGKTNEIDLCKVSVEDKFIEFPDLLAYWDYSITVEAVTEAGVSEWTKPVKAKTSTNFPGMASFTLTQDEDIATNLTINIQCPDEMNRNGTISKYIINKYNVESNTSQYQTVNVNNNCLENTSVQLDNITVEYTYIITVQVQNQDYTGLFSPPVQIFVAPKRSGPVKRVYINNVTNTSVTINWQKPTLPNGIISGYLVEVKLNNNCVHADRIICTTCDNKSCSTNTCQVKKEIRKSSQELDSNLNVTISDLMPYKEYNFCITAINEVGCGHSSCKGFKTKPGTPYMVMNVTYEPISYPPKEKPITVGLKISWTPGKYTGPTNYTVCLKGKNNINQSCKYNVEKSFIEFPDLLAYWDYNITIQAVTEAGVSVWSQPIKAKTSTNFPGTASFTMTQDKDIATNLTINIQCPDEINQNGTISEFIINKYNIDTNTSQNQTVIEHNNCAENSNVQLHNITADCTYLITVQVQNQDYSGSFSPSVQIFVAPKPPIFSSTKSEVIKKVVYSTTSQVEVNVCVSCISNTKQGKITEAGLVVCLDVPTSSCFSLNRKRRSIAQEGLNTTWFQSKSENFVLPYRTTSGNWIQTVQRFSYINYTVGNENCNNENTFCNGPLPPDTKVRLQVIVCTGGGCSESTFIDLQTQAETDNNMPAILGGVVGAILGLVVIVAVVFLVVYLKRHPRNSNSPIKLDSRSQVHSSKHIKDNRPVLMSKFKEHVWRSNKDSQLLFQSEFEDISALSKEFPHTCNEAKKENNRVKNRYSNILPYDHSRVKLVVQPENDDPDFINANYIPGYCSVREYIATQGPIQCTIPDFWTMVWEQRSRIIVMLSDLTENDRPKVTLYWPENLGEPINYGNVIVEMTNFSSFDKYIIRNFKITKGTETRKVTHLFIVGWSDFLADLPAEVVIKFVRIFRQEANSLISGPVIVHCSAGVGRTGTFIALDYFMQYIEQHSLTESLDVFGFVMKMRNYRPCMVQSEKQYIYIHEVLDILIDQKIKSELEENNVYNNDGDLYANINSNPGESIYANQSFEYDM